MPNRLRTESSPYLRAHAEDPVDWMPWGAEAILRARELDRPIFLSVGYAACHWCHVMHRESFSDPDIAELLNADFISVKVDRESRPDVDELYMAYVVASTGRGGWPMSVFLTPDLLPFFGGTYFPREPLDGMPSFQGVLRQITFAFRKRRTEVDQAAEDARSYVATMFAPLPQGDVSRETVDRAAAHLVSQADPRHGGFGGAPKFPQAPVVDFLLAHHRVSGDARSFAAARSAVEGMVRGGIYDQAGGGIARYSVDAQWLVPHFEKMLYDNAMMLSTLAELHRLDPRDEWAHSMRQTADFLERDLYVDGAYASSLDADTLGEEGATYVWGYEELANALDAHELALAEAELGVTPGGNFEGHNILTRVAGRGENAHAVDRLLDALLLIRQKRPQPALDEKIVVSWNALAALGLMEAGDALDDPAITDRGVRIVRLLLDRSVDDSGGVARLVNDPASAGVRLLEDAAALALALLRAAELTGETVLGGFAQRVFDRACQVFLDGEGTWYMTPAGTELPARPREQHDNPLPSGASLAALFALRLGASTGDDAYIQLAEASLRRAASLARQSPSAAGTALSAMLQLLAVR